MMWYKVVGLVIFGLMFFNAGCEKTKYKTDTVTEYVEVPVDPTPIPPIEPDEPSIPTAGVGSIKGDMDCNGGTIETKYSFGNTAEDDKNFVIQYQRNGATEDLVYPSTTQNGSRATVQDVYYVRANDEDFDARWIVTILYQTPDQTYSLVTTTIKQPACEVDEDDNITALTTIYEVK